MKFSIITVTFNAEKSLPVTLDSIRSQTLKDYELIIIDGKSTDKTFMIIESYTDIINSFVSEKDSGIYDAMNKGIERALGEYCLFLNAGDALIDALVLERVASKIDSNPNNDIYIGYADYENKGFITTRKPNFNNLPYSFCHQALFFSTAILKKYRYDINYRFSGDSELLYRLIENGIQYLFIDEKIVLEEGGVGATASNLMTSAKELFSIPFICRNTSWMYRYYRLFKIAVYIFLRKANIIKA